VNYKFGTDPRAAAYASAAPSSVYLKALQLPADWSLEVGARYYVSGGRKAQDLGDVPGNDDIVSRLTYNGMTGHATEIFARLDHRDGISSKSISGSATFSAASSTTRISRPASPRTRTRSRPSATAGCATARSTSATT